MKKILSVAIICVMLAAMLCGCGGNNNNNGSLDGGLGTPATQAGLTIPTQSGSADVNTQTGVQSMVGTWEMRANLHAMVNSMAGMQGAEEALAIFTMMDGIQFSPITFTAEFTASGEMVMDMNSMVQTVTTLCNDMLAWMKQGDNFYTFYEKTQGVSRAQLEAMLQQQGTSVQQVIAMIEQQFAALPQQLQQSMNSATATMPKTYYKLEGNRLYTWTDTANNGDYMVLEFVGNQIYVLQNVTSEGTVNFDRGAFTMTRK